MGRNTRIPDKPLSPLQQSLSDAFPSPPRPPHPLYPRKDSTRDRSAAPLLHTAMPAPALRPPGRAAPSAHGRKRGSCGAAWPRLSAVLNATKEHEYLTLVKNRSASEELRRLCEEQR